jgi:hypothetical protein
MSSEQYKHWFAGLPARAIASSKIALCGFSFPISDEKRVRFASKASESKLVGNKLRISARVVNPPVLEMIPRRDPDCRRLFSNTCAPGSQRRGAVTSVSPRSKKTTVMAKAIASFRSSRAPLIDSDSSKAGLDSRDFFVQGGRCKISEQGSGAVENSSAAVDELRGSRQPLRYR